MTEEAIRSPITGFRRVKIPRAIRIEEAGHDPISGVIEVRFVTGAVYQYHGFDQYTFESWLKAGDQQKFFDAEIYGKQNAQRHVCVTQNEDADPRRRDDHGERPLIA